MYVFPKISVGNYIHNSSHTHTHKKKKIKKEANKTKQEKWDLTCK